MDLGPLSACTDGARDPSACAALPAPAEAACPAPAPPASLPATILDFTPVAVAHRADGWTAEKQRAFIEALADTGSVPAAARAVGMGVEGAYRLRRRADAAAFAQAWDAAYGMMVQRLTDAAFARAIHGVVNPIFFQGDVVGERVSYDERLTRFLLERHDPRGHGDLRGADPAWAAKRDPLAPRLARLPRLLGKLFGIAGEPAPAGEEQAAEPAAAPALPARRRRRA